MNSTGPTIYCEECAQLVEKRSRRDAFRYHDLFQIDGVKVLADRRGCAPTSLHWYARLLAQQPQQAGIDAFLRQSWDHVQQLNANRQFLSEEERTQFQQSYEESIRFFREGNPGSQSDELARRLAKTAFDQLTDTLFKANATTIAQTTHRYTRTTRTFQPTTLRSMTLKAQARPTLAAPTKVKRTTSTLRPPTLKRVKKETPEEPPREVLPELPKEEFADLDDLQIDLE